MPLMGFESLSVKLGEKILNDLGVPFDRVLGVDFSVDWFNGTDVTPADVWYAAVVTYARGSDVLNHSRSYDYLSEIVSALEDIEDDLRMS